jgi:predicted TIM-barrel fold metal-dependent hydrolase
MADAKVCVGPQPPRQPKCALPRGATDCHCHVFEAPERYPLSNNLSYAPALAPLSEYLRMCEVVGIQRTVQVNASVYGFDNSITLDVIARVGQDRARGVAGLPPDVSAAEVERLHAGGFRGVRLSTKVKGYGGTEAIDAIAAKVKPFGWHVQLHFGDSGTIAAIESQLVACPVPVVFDHLGCMRGNESPDAPGFQALLRILARRDDCWVKISSFHGRPVSGPPGYSDMKPFAQALVDTRRDRVVWGTNWPHPNHFPPSVTPNDADLVDVFCDWFPDADVRQQVMVENPARLYGFA